MNMLFPITGVGLGPGDPDLITVKGLRMLQLADVIFYPASAIGEERVSSFSLPILQKLDVSEKAVPLLLPMNSADRERCYLEAYALIRKEYDKGLKVVVVSEGDILFYSTFGYLLKLIKQDRIPFYLIPGMPAFIHGASEMGQPLVEGAGRFSVMALPRSFDEVAQQLGDGRALVVMKPKVLEGWHSFLKRVDRPFFYAEYLGTPKQFVTASADELIDRDIPYFAVVIFPFYEGM